MITCVKCGKKANINLSYSQPYCQPHFLQIIEKRIKKELKNKLDLKKEYAILKEDTAQFEINYHFLKKIFYKLKIKTVKSKNYQINNKCLDEISQEFLEAFTCNKKIIKEKISPLKNITLEDIQHLKKILGIKFKIKTSKDFLKDLDNKYPGTKFSVLKSYDFIKNLENSSKKEQ
ncbi:MAG: hypothetical protein ACMXX7_00995 [Candidatus Woesearchaeota archaeon]